MAAGGARQVRPGAGRRAMAIRAITGTVHVTVAIQLLRSWPDADVYPFGTY